MECHIPSSGMLLFIIHFLLHGTKLSLDRDLYQVWYNVLVQLWILEGKGLLW